MRRVTLMLAAMAVMVSLFAVAAYAADIEGTKRGDELFESDRGDWIAGRSGVDKIDASSFNDDTDHVRGNRGADTIWVDDGDYLDKAIGGKGYDTCYGDPGDELDCDVEIYPPVQ
jgi:Ca2+-binding RTX toxin-like protein